jgi:hypothetical protein
MVGLVDYVQQIGPSGVVNEVEANSRARRIVQRSNDYDHGTYAIGFGGSVSGGSTGGTAQTNQILAGWQWASTKNFALVKKIVGYIWVMASASPGIVRLAVTKASSYTLQFDTYVGTTLPFTAAAGILSPSMGVGNKLRTVQLNSDASSGGQIAASGARGAGPSLVYSSVGQGTNVYLPPLTGGNYTLDPLPLGQFVTSAAPNPGRTPWQNQTLFDTEIGPPLALENFSGLIFTYDAPALVSGNISFGYSINLQWDEVTTYPLGNFT